MRRTGAGASLEPADSPGFLLWRATLRWQRAMAAVLKPIGLTHAQFVILVSLWWLTRTSGEGSSQRNLADHAGTDPMMTSQILRALEARGYVARRSDPGDSRVRLVSPTPAGEALAGRAVAIVEAADKAFFESAGDPAAVLNVLRPLAGK